jgi:transposase, IS5 family
VGDSLRLRQFCRLGLHAPPDDTTLIKWANLITPPTMERFNERVVELARQLKVTRGRKLRVDSTLTETTMHHPTDGSLLADGVRVLSRLLRDAKAVGGAAVGLGTRVFASHHRRARQFVRVIHGLARRVREAEAAGKPAKRREGEARGESSPRAAAGGRCGGGRRGSAGDRHPTARRCGPRPGRQHPRGEEAAGGAGSDEGGV